MTRQRRVILEELRKVRCHPTADEIYVRVRRRLPRISLGTVYRNLELLTATGLVRRIEPAGSQGPSRYDGDTAAHYHVRCLGCGRIGDVPAGPVAGIEEPFRGSSEFEIVGHRLELLGWCPRCKKGTTERRTS